MDAGAICDVCAELDAYEAGVGTLFTSVVESTTAVVACGTLDWAAVGIDETITLVPADTIVVCADDGAICDVCTEFDAYEAGVGALVANVVETTTAVVAGKLLDLAAVRIDMTSDAAVWAPALVAGLALPGCGDWTAVE